MKSINSIKSKFPILLSAALLTMCLMTGCGSNTDTARNSTGTTGNTAQNQPVPVNDSNSENIAKEEAEAIALEAAGFTADQVSGLHTKYEVDDSVPQYEVDFYAENTEYDYTIHAQTGEVLSYDTDNAND